MSSDLDHLYELLPAIYRIRDAERSIPAPASGPTDEILEPLQALVSVLAQQARVLEENIEQLYDDPFIETCADWVVPYIGDLVGARPLHTPAGSGLSERADIANTIAYRRRKGTVAVLEQLAQDVTGWRSHVVEFFQHLITTQYLNHIRLTNLATPDLRQWEPLERLPTPFDSTNRTLEVRRIAPGRGRFNIPNVGIFLWRLEAYALDDVPATALDAERYRFNPLGIDTPLYTLPATEPTITHLSHPLNVPLPISRRVLDSDLESHTGSYVGLGLSLLVTVDGKAVPIVACDLSDQGAVWAHVPRATYAVDPVLGRLALPTSMPAGPHDVRVSYHYGFSADLGGGQYDRAATIDTTLEPLVLVPQADSLDHALGQSHSGAIEITDNATHGPGTATISVDAAAKLEVRAHDGRRPVVQLTKTLTATGGDEAELTIDGLVIVGGALEIDGNLRLLTLRHCTLVPGLGFAPDGSPAQPSAPSLVVKSAGTQVVVERSIVGGIRTVAGVAVQVTDSFVDAGDPANVAYAAIDGTGPGGPLEVEASTLIGRVHADSIPLASNAIFLAAPGAAPWEAPVRAERRQEGCVRFSWLPLESQVPRRYRCRPAAGDDPLRMRPSFTSLRYGDAAYGQLGPRCPDEIASGADDESEMGAFHLLYQPQREANLRIRLEEYLRFGLEAGIFYAS